jgi:hypothetical protein
MSERAPNLHPETLKQFEALERVRDLRRFLPSRGGMRMDSSGLLAVDPATPLGQLAVEVSTRRNHAAGADSREGAARPVRWHEDPRVICALGLASVVATGVLTYLVLLLLNY